MKHFRKIWDEEKNEWIRANKGLNKQEMYEAFMKLFPDSEVTYQALLNQRSRLKCSFGGVQTNPAPRRHRPVGSEHVKKGYVRIKIAEPNVWISKARWVYEQAHPDFVYTKGDNFVFLDGNNRNFEPDNIEAVNNRYMGVFNSFGGCEKDNPEVTRMHILQAKLKMAMLDAGEKAGLVVSHGSGRRFRDELNAYGRVQNKRYREEHIDHARALERARYRRRTPEQKAKFRAYQREWQKKKRQEGKK